MQLHMTIAELHAFLAEVFPQLGPRFQIVDLATGRALVRMTAAEADLRPGGTVSGPTLFALADVAFYATILAVIGPEPLTVTTSCAMDFLRKPVPGPLTAETRILKLGRTLCVGDALLRSEGSEAPVARASLTYAIPPRGAS